ncbi:MAG: hypothetical protein JWR07_1235 [Nevskia sp.]|nr:hypothetical protein [Nevskia sp.]
MHGEQKGPFARLFLKLTLPIVFGNRKLTLAVIGALTLFMAYEASRLKLDAGFEKQLPLGHPYIQVFEKYRQDFGGANTVLFSLTLNKGHGDIYQPSFMNTYKALTSAVFFIPGIDRAHVSSLFTPDTRYVEVVEDGFRGGNIIPSNFSPTPEMMEEVRSHVFKAKFVGRYVSNDQTGAMVFSELLERDPVTDEKLDYFATAHLIEEVRRQFISPKMFEYRLKNDHAPLKAGAVVKQEYIDPRGALSGFKVVQALVGGEHYSFKADELDLKESDNPDYNPNVDIQIVGFCKAVGDIADATLEVVAFFALTLFLVWLILWWYTSSPFIALLPLSCGVLAVVWELGILHLAGYGLDPFAILVPFLVLAISVSHGIQITSFWLLEISTRGSNSFDASRNTYSRLVIPGITALLTNVVGFGTILLIPVGIIREMAINAMFGLMAVIVCKKILLPCLLSYVKLGNPARFRERQLKRDASLLHLWKLIAYVTQPRWAVVVLALAAMTWGAAEYIGRDLKYGELHPGVPELRPSSRYNQDSETIARNYAIGVDIFKVIAEDKENGCIDYRSMTEIDRFGWRMQNTPGVQSTLSMPQVEKTVFQAFSEGNPKFFNLPRDSDGLVLAGQQVPTSSGLLNKDCSAMPVFVFTTDHKAKTIDGIVASANQFIAEQKPDARVKFRLASGNVGVMAASNDTVKASDHKVLLWLYACIALCVWVSFRSISAVICILVPLALVSVFTYAVMVFLDIGVTVSTLPVAAFAAGIGVDYGIYIYSVLEECVQARGMPLREAYIETLNQTGKAVIVTAAALAASVCTWLLSDLQFQVNMGILLTIMFIANAAAAVILLPAFAAFLMKRPKLVAAPVGEEPV